MFGWGRTSVKQVQEAPKETPSRKICVPVDDSEHSIDALKWAVKNLVTPNDTIHLVSVEPPVAGPYSPEMPESDVPGPNSLQVREWHAQQAVAHEDAEHTLSVCRKQAEALGVPPANIRAVQLAPSGGASGVGESIVRYAATTDSSMLVVGSRGMGGLKRHFMAMMGLGSVSDYALRHAACPVVVVKPKDAEGAAGSNSS